jgi:3-methyladenine DNA glycosylase AlkC
MPEPFKNFIDAKVVRGAGHHLQRVWPGFARARFERLALAGLDALELKARAHRIADALEATLPVDFAQAADVLEAVLGPPAQDDTLTSMRSSDAGLAGWAVWPMTEFVARRGLDDPQRALAALHAMTQRFSAECAIRPFIVRHPVLTFDTLQRWTHDASPHVRRLVSEGSRPRLPWGSQLKSLIADASPTLPLLRALQDDPSAYVRRSVANHLNDIAKDHPGLIAQWVSEHLVGASAERRALLRHASRTLIKRGDPTVLSLWGHGSPLRGDAGLHIAPKQARVGDTLQLTVTLVSRSARPQNLAVDYAVHHVGARGGTSPKVFKGWTLTLPAREAIERSRRHSLRPVTTRRYHAGAHQIDLLVNGRVVAQASFRLKDGSQAAGAGR